jgi:hypothetical protein
VAEAETEAEAEAEPEAETEAVAEAEPEAETEAVAEAEPAPAMTRTPPTKTRRRRAASMTDTASADPPDPSTSPPVAAPTAFLRVRRHGSAQETIEVDGQAHGFTPRMLSLPAGTHHVVVRDASSRELVVDQRVELEPHHTRVAPLSL